MLASSPLVGGTFEPSFFPRPSAPASMPLVPCTGIFLGPSISGKTVALISLILEQCRGVFERIYVFSPSVNIDDGWIPVKNYIGVNTEREQAYWDEWDEPALRRIIQQQRKITEASKKLEMKKLYQVLIITGRLFCVLFFGPKTLFFRVRVLCQNNPFFGSVFLPKILGREGGLDVWTIRWLREFFLLCQLVVKLGARAAMDIYGVDADELAHCVALHVIEMKIDEIIVRKCSRVLRRLIVERTGRRAAMFPFAVVLPGMERALISPLPSDDMAREPLVRDLCSPGSPGPTQLPRVTAEDFVEESTQVLHFLNELADIDCQFTPLEMLLDDACLTLRELVCLPLNSD